MIINILISSVAFFLGAYLLPGVQIKNFIQALIVAIVVAVLSVTVGNFLKLVTLGLLSYGIFNWLLNAIIIQIADYFLPDFKVKNFWWALALAAIVSITNSVIKGIF